MGSPSNEITFRYPSKAFSYGFAEQRFVLEEDVTPAEIAMMYVTAVREYQDAEVAAAKASKPEAEKAVEKMITKQLGGKVIDVSVNENAVQDAADLMSPDEKSDKAPWEKPAPAVAAKPWEGQAPKVSLF